jgi:hypothetical protein
MGDSTAIVSIHRLDEETNRRKVLADLTCDSDGKISRFIGGGGGRRPLASGSSISIISGAASGTSSASSWVNQIFSWKLHVMFSKHSLAAVSTGSTIVGNSLVKIFT